METAVIQGVQLTLARAEALESEWVDYNGYAQQLEAAWMRLSDSEISLSPRLIGEPGLGKTTLACAVGRKMGREVYIFQCTMDTRPEDLVVTPVLTGQKQVEYRASSLVTAMIRGAAIVLDEGNRMPERAWAALAPLMDDRRYVESAVAGIKIKAHPDFRLCVTMNDDSSVYELPAYIQSRLKPKIDIVKPEWRMQEKILKLKCPEVDGKLLRDIFELLKKRQKENEVDSIRDMLTLARYAQRLQSAGVKAALEKAVNQVLRGANAA